MKIINWCLPVCSVVISFQNQPPDCRVEVRFNQQAEIAWKLSSSSHARRRTPVWVDLFPGKKEKKERYQLLLKCQLIKLSWLISFFDKIIKGLDFSPIGLWTYDLIPKFFHCKIFSLILFNIQNKLKPFKLRLSTFFGIRFLSIQIKYLNQFK